MCKVVQNHQATIVPTGAFLVGQLNNCTCSGFQQLHYTGRKGAKGSLVHSLAKRLQFSKKKHKNATTPITPSRSPHLSHADEASHDSSVHASITPRPPLSGAGASGTRTLITDSFTDHGERQWRGGAFSSPICPQLPKTKSPAGLQ